jgi:hypothetical protein
MTSGRGEKKEKKKKEKERKCEGGWDIYKMNVLYVCSLV